MSSTAEQVAVVLTSLGLGGVAVKLIEVWNARNSEHRKEPADMTRAAAELQEAMSEGSQDLLAEFRKEFRFLRGRVVDLQRDADAARNEAKLARGLAESAVADHALCQIEVKALRAKIERMMADRPPAPPYDTITRPVG